MDKKEEGSITVFLSIIFLLFFALIGVAFENVRSLSSVSYVRAAACSAAATVFADYNRELYEDYGLFGYGGVDGKGVQDLEAVYERTLLENMCTSPINSKETFSDLYACTGVEAVIKDAYSLTNTEEFIGQIQMYLKQKAITDISEAVKDKLQQKDTKEIQGKLEMTKDYENGKYDDKNELRQEEEKKESKKDEVKEESSNREEQSQDGKEDMTDTKDCAGGNPLKTFTNLARDGVLQLVCDNKKLADGVVEPRNTEEEEKEDSSDRKDDVNEEKTESKAAEILSDILQKDNVNEKENQKKNMMIATKNKAALLCYANDVFSSYVHEKDRTTKYGLEYLIGGKKEEKDNLANVVNRLLVIRMLLNFAYVVKAPVLQEKSLATATAIAGITGLTPVIHAVQYTILLILAFQEACIDVCALLKGKEVPVIKKESDFQMKYEEICIGTKELFSKKADSYPQDSKKVMSSSLSYRQYLWGFLMMLPEDLLMKRTFDLVQYDLRQKYNQTFCIDTCISHSRYRIVYQTPFLFGNLPYLDKTAFVQKSTYHNLEVDYGYKSR